MSKNSLEFWEWTQGFEAWSPWRPSGRTLTSFQTVNWMRRSWSHHVTSKGLKEALYDRVPASNVWRGNAWRCMVEGIVRNPGFQPCSCCLCEICALQQSHCGEKTWDWLECCRELASVKQFWKTSNDQKPHPYQTSNPQAFCCFLASGGCQSGSWQLKGHACGAPREWVMSERRWATSV